MMRRIYRRYVVVDANGRWRGYLGTGPFLWNLKGEAWEAAGPDDDVVAANVRVTLAKPKRKTGGR